MRRGATLAAAVAILAAGAAGGLFAWSYGVFTDPRPLVMPVHLIVPKGASLPRIARLLEGTGAIDDAGIFVWAARLSGDQSRIKAGEYVFTGSPSQRDILQKMVVGEVVERRLTIVEGMTVRQVISLLEATESLSGAVGPLPEEGSILPETYAYRYGMTRRRLVEIMTEAMRDTLARLWRSRRDGLALASPREALILASIIEKETALPEERQRIAGVFLNRLARGMRLQSDPTVIYDLSGRWGRLDAPLTRADLATPGAHNTYRLPGLPSGPICNPGIAALAAVLDPADTDELYFVADGQGGHVFAETLADHNRNVARWSRLRVGAGEGSPEQSPKEEKSPGKLPGKLQKESGKASVPKSR